MTCGVNRLYTEMATAIDKYLLPSVDVNAVVCAISHQIRVHNVVLHNTASKYNSTTVLRTHCHAVDTSDILRKK